MIVKNVGTDVCSALLYLGYSLPSQESENDQTKAFFVVSYAENDNQSISLGDEQPHKPGSQPIHRHAWSEGEEIDDLENTEQILAERDALASAFTWGTTTQRYDSSIV